MSKIHSESRVTDNKGTAAFYTYCSNHKPAISWRGVSNDDIGIDGEVELYNINGEPLAEIIKVQLKSSEKSKGYIQNENPINKTFTFYAEKAHVEYWQELQNDVLLVIYDNRNDANKLYAKKVENIDVENIGTVKVPIQFHMEHDLLDLKHNEFLERFSRSYNKTNPKIRPTSQGGEKLVTNLLKISFLNNRIYIAPINFDREEVIRNSWNTNRKLKITAGAREVVQSALHQKELRFSSDWTVFNKQIITFHNLNNNDLPISKVIDKSMIESFTTEEFYQINDDYKSVFKTLVRYCMQQVLFKKNFSWDTDDNLFRYSVPQKFRQEIDSLIEAKSLEGQKGFTYKGKEYNHKESWKGSKSAQRTVLKAKYWEKGKRYYCTHFAFELDILDFDNTFYLCLNPTWQFTVNGLYKSKIGHKRVSQIKKVERNLSVYNHLRFIAYKLIYRDLFTTDYSFVDFHDLIKLDIDKRIDETLWVATEEQEEIDLLKDEEAPNDIDNEAQTL